MIDVSYIATDESVQNLPRVLTHDRGHKEPSHNSVLPTVAS